MTSTLSHFWQLASSSKEDRLASAHALVKGLAPENNNRGSIQKGKQPLFEDGLGKREEDVPENVTDAQLGQAESALESTGNPDLVYAIKRLTKGLASHRESARLGFSVALCELFQRTRSISTQHAIDLILAYSKPAQKIKGQEERDMLFARLFGLHALVRSEVLCDSSVTNQEDFQRIIRILHNISSGKHWLRESGTSVIVQAIEQLSKTNNPPSWKSNALKWLVEIVCNDDRVTADSVALFMTLKQNSPESFASAQRLPRFANQELLSSANVPILARILRDARGEDANDEEATPSYASGSTQAHFVWDMIFSQYADTASAGGQKAPFDVMYRILVDDNLFAVTSSHQKKAWGFQLIQRAARIVDQSYVSDIFMPNLMRTLLNQLSAKDPILQKAAQRACIGLQQAVKERPSIAYDVVLRLTDPSVNYRFDSVTNTKTVETILRSTPSDDVRRYADRLILSACHEQSNGKRASILDSLLILVRNAQIDTDDACIENILTFFAAHGLFTMKKALEKAPSSRASLTIAPVSEGFSSSVQSSCRSRFLSCLSDLHAASASVQQNREDVDWISRGNEIIIALDKDSQHFTRLPKTQHEILGKVEKTLKSLRSGSEKAEGSKKDRYQSYSTLLLASSIYAQAALQQEEEVNELIEPMLECANQLLTNKKAVSSKSDADSPGPMELFIDCLSNALQQPTAFLRSIATQAFDAFAEDMTQSSVRLLIEQLGFNQGNNGEEGVEEDKNEGEEEDDVMSDSVSDTSATSTSSEVDDEDVDAEFAKKIREALQSGGIADKEERSEGEDAEDDDDDESDSSSVSMEDFDDEQMILMDDKLADIFRQKYATRKQEDEARKEEATFHVRIIDLLDHFALRQGDNALCVEMVLPLFTIAFEKDKALGQLRQKATTVLRKTLLKGGSSGSGNKLNVVGTSSMQSALDSLDAVHKMAATNLTSDQMSLANACNLYLTKSCSPPDQDVPEKVRSIYVATLNDFLERKNNNLKPSFLIDAFSRFPHLAFSLRDELLQAASGEQSSSQNAFRQVQVMEMLRVCIANLIGQLQQQQNLSEGITVQGIQKLLQNLAELTFRRVKHDQHRIKEVLKSALPYVRLTRKLVEQVKQKTGKEAEAEIQEIWPKSEIQSAMEALNTTNIMPNSASLQGLLKQMLALTTVDEKKDGKRKKGEDDSTLDQSKSSTKGKKKAKKVD
ncbi:uncharacterized protein FA14DRAFT_130502 [Meira miltonrushii]|uniref:DNA polymerase V n=1 Tax=Meira miltonrushii TaxID=1280837 RepID=A0A316VKC1_9BASI|nr:uncharacterized protein FA14DRAFT_130502 [Meira miltonrushii]PWN37684.1 hypothetical protein FA14DRAFT_130502 [Meira miltonrushii]